MTFEAMSMIQSAFESCGVALFNKNKGLSIKQTSSAHSSPKADHIMQHSSQVHSYFVNLSEDQSGNLRTCAGSAQLHPYQSRWSSRESFLRDACLAGVH